MIINLITSDWKMYVNVFYAFLKEKEKSIYYGNKVITDTSINNYIESLNCINHKNIVNGCYKMFKTMK